MDEQNNSEVLSGWEFMARQMGASFAAEQGRQYVGRVEQAIKDFGTSVNQLKSQQTDAVLGGFVAEEWHGGTFNIDATAAGSKSRAVVIHSHDKASVDIRLQSHGKSIDYSSKYYATPEKSVKQQALLNDDRSAKYGGQQRLIPSDQLEPGKQVAHRFGISNEPTRPEVANAYKETEAALTDRLTDGHGVESRPLSKKEDLQIAQEVKSDKGFSPEDHGITADSAIKPEYMLKRAVQAGLTAVAVSAMLEAAPEFVNAIDYLIKTGEIDSEQFKKVGMKAISGGAEGFLRGSVACMLQIMCEKGALGSTLQSWFAAKNTLAPTILGSVVALTMDTVKNGIMVAAGKMEARAMGAAFIDSASITASYIIGAKIGGVIVQAVGWQFPGAAYLVGSLIGCAIAAAYNFTKKQLISFCVDTGFTCFGLVEQNYELPEEVIWELGIDMIPVPTVEINEIRIDGGEIETVEAERAIPEVIRLTVLRRGVIGVNKIGYV